MLKNLKKKILFSALCSGCILSSFGIGSIIMNTNKTENSIINKDTDKIISLIEPYKCHCKSKKIKIEQNESNDLNEIIAHYNKETELNKSNSIKIDNEFSHLQEEILENINVNVIK